ncbi:MAG TPA: adenylate/guanylate cyclase domain-containing protein [Fimbriimonadaceae bacterium]|nr:adenylate/guanylate cyclase domain-containing protein [Fimbriimonadaceae bacterium]
MLRHEGSTEKRYDPEAAKKVFELASRLERDNADRLTVEEIEKIADEAGLNADYVREAVAQIERDRLERELRLKQRRQRRPSSTARGSAREFYTLLIALLIPLGFASAAFFVAPSLAFFFTTVLALPVALLLGFLAGKRWISMVAAFLMGLALIPSLDRAFDARYPLSTGKAPEITMGEGGISIPILPGMTLSEEGAAIAPTADFDAQRRREIDERAKRQSMTTGFGLMLLPFAALIGAGTRRRYFPTETPREENETTGDDRGTLLEQYFALQAKLEGQKRRCAFLSIDVVGSSAMKASGNALVIEHAFSRYQKWIAETAAEFGGEVQAAAGDGAMCMFPSEAGALRAARKLQTEINAFNTKDNPLGIPFTLRCGISVGDVPWSERTPIGKLQSPVIDRAAALQKSAAPGQIVVEADVAATALIELGSLDPVASGPEGPAFGWTPSS